MKDIPEGQGSPSRGAVGGGRPLAVVRDAKPGGTAPGTVKWPCHTCETASLCKLNGVCLHAANKRESMNKG